MYRIALSLAFAATSAHAQAPLYTVSTYGGTEPGCTVTNSPTPVSVAGCINAGGCNGYFTYGDCSASSFSHQVWGKVVQARSSGWNSCGGGWRSNADAYQTIEVVFSGPGTHVTTRARIAFEAVWTFSSPNTIDMGGGSLFMRNWTWNPAWNNASTVQIGHTVAGGFNIYNPYGAAIEQLGPMTWRASGTYVGVEAGFPLNVPVRVNIGTQLDLHNGDIGAAGTSATITLEANAHLSGTQAFDLPPGYTANAPAYHIVDNQWIDPRAAHVTVQPSAATTCPGGAATLSVSAAGEGTIAFQWRKKGSPLADGTNPDGSVTAGSTTDTLTITGTLAAEAGSYDCVVSNAFGSSTSSSASLAYCYANCDCSTVSPILTANDFQCFLNTFSLQSEIANCDSSSVAPILTANDFQCFLNAYANGCP